MGDDDPIDGRSFLPRLKGEAGNPREWVLCHYQPYWNKVPGQFARTQQLKLYRDGRYFQIPNDLKEEKDLSKSDIGKEERQKLEALLKQCPPAPTEKAGSRVKGRPTYADWKDIVK